MILIKKCEVCVSRLRKKSEMKQGKVRIIGGDWRGRKLPVLSLNGLRPTSDRVRETLFNWLQYEVAGAKCLDMFAGTGALGLEALSRGAETVTFLDNTTSVVKQLRQNLDTLHVDKARVIQDDSLKWVIQEQHLSFDIIFVDPPFHSHLMQPAVDALFLGGCIAKQGCLYLEQEKTLPWPVLPNGWKIFREKTTSQVRFGVFKYEEERIK